MDIVFFCKHGRRDFGLFYRLDYHSGREIAVTFKKWLRFLGRMGLSFDIKDVLGGKKFTLDDVLAGISKEERHSTEKWLEKLRDVERQNVVGSLATVLALQQVGNNSYPERPVGFAMVAAGSSINSSRYNDIDLFMVPETFEHGRVMQNIVLLNHIANYLAGMPHYLRSGYPLGGPSDLTIKAGKNGLLKGFNCLFRFKDDYEPGTKLGNDEKAYGKELQMYLLLDKFDFEFQRTGKQKDIIYRPLLNAEQIIELNKRSETNMRVLGRSYVLGTDYPTTTLADLAVDPNKVVEYYGQQIRIMLDNVADKYLGRLDRLFQLSLDMARGIRGDSALAHRKMLMERMFPLIDDVTDNQVYFEKHVSAFKNYINAKINGEVKAAFK